MAHALRRGCYRPGVVDNAHSRIATWGKYDYLTLCTLGSLFNLLNMISCGGVAVSTAFGLLLLYLHRERVDGVLGLMVPDVIRQKSRIVGYCALSCCAVVEFQVLSKLTPLHDQKPFCNDIVNHDSKNKCLRTAAPILRAWLWAGLCDNLLAKWLCAGLCTQLGCMCSLTGSNLAALITYE